MCGSVVATVATDMLYYQDEPLLQFIGVRVPFKLEFVVVLTRWLTRDG